MNEEMMTEEMNNEVETEVEATETSTELVERDETEVETTDGNGKGILLAGAVALGLGAIALFKNRHKIAAWNTNRRIKKLEKAGFTVTRGRRCEAEVLDECDYEEVIEDVEESSDEE